MNETERRHRRFTSGLGPEIPHRSRGELTDLRKDTEEAFERLGSDREFDKWTRFQFSRVLGSLKETHRKITSILHHIRIGETLWSGTAVITPVKDAFTVAAADLNAAAADSFKRKFALSVVTPKGEKCFLLTGLAPTLTPGEVVADADVGVPVITGTPVLDKGSVIAEITFDTDAGVTKTYVATDEVSVDCDLTVSGIALPRATVTWTVV